tara:strand:+ start:61 stop:774 length:714 start_codon:yes stop_codon:yes gene_type:complete
MKKSIVRNNDICKDLLLRREKMGLLTPEILTKYRRYARNKKAQLFEEGYVGDEHEYWLRHYCSAWLRDKKPSRMDKSNKRRRNCPIHKNKAKESKYKRMNLNLWGFTESMWNDYAFADMRRKNPRRVMWKTRKELYHWLVKQLEKQNHRSAHRNERGIYPKMTRIRDGNLTPKENFNIKTNLSIDRIFNKYGYVEGNMRLVQRQQNKDKNAIHYYQAEDVIKDMRKAKKFFDKKYKK